MPEDVLKYMGSCFHKARMDLGLTHEQLSVESGVSLRHIADIEKGIKQDGILGLQLFNGRELLQI